MRHSRRLAGGTRTPEANRHLGLILAAVAGAANAGGFLAVQQYTSHITGIVSAMADGLALAQYPLVVAGLGSVAAFLGGAASTAVMVNAARARGLKSAYALPLVVEASLLLAFGLLGSQLTAIHAAFTSAAVMLLCYIMGLQNALITKVSHAEIRTTHVTGLVTDLGIEIGRLCYWRCGGRMANNVAEASSVRARVLGSMLLAFFLGGVAGAFAFTRFGFVATVPLAALLYLLCVGPLVDDVRAGPRAEER